MRKQERQGSIFTLNNLFKVTLILMCIYLFISHITIQRELEDQLNSLIDESEALQNETKGYILQRKMLENQILDYLLINSKKEQELAQIETQIDAQSGALRELTGKLQDFQNLRGKLMEQELLKGKPKEPQSQLLTPSNVEDKSQRKGEKIEIQNQNDNNNNNNNNNNKIETTQLQAPNKEVLDILKAAQGEKSPPKPGEDTEKKEAVRRALLHAWNSYKTYAWGHDELKPVSKTSGNWLGQGLTIIDALDTLWIMEEYEEFYLGRDWVASSLSFDKNRDISVFETTIRVLGGLLSAYEFSRDKVFLDRSEDLAKILLKSFNSPSGLPFASVNLQSGRASSPGWTGGSSILSEMGTLQLEFLYLAYHTGKAEYAVLPMEVFKKLDKFPTSIKGLYPLYVDIQKGAFRGAEYSLGGLGDSFYEYMIKLWILTGKEVEGYRRMYEESSTAIKNNLVKKSNSGFRYVGHLNNQNFQQKMEHLTCFAGGMFALGYIHDISNDAEVDLELGADITATCHESYDRQSTKIGPESFDMNSGREFTPIGRYYILRPETVESYFVLWRTTHDQKYRDWAWEAFQAIEKHCRVDGGYSGISDVNHPLPDDTQQTFFLAETLKYLYLTFTDDSVIPLDKYVFNTEAHPLGVFEKKIDQWPQDLKDTLLME